MAIPTIESKAVSVQRIGLARLLGWSALALLLVSIALLLLVIAALNTLSAYLLDVAFWVASEAVPLMMLASPVLALAALVVRSLHLARPGSLSIEGDHLLVRRGARARRTPLGAIAEGWVSPLKQQIEVRLKNGDMVRAVVGSEAHAHALLDVLGLSASRRTMNMQLGETTFLDIMTWLCAPCLVLPFSMAIVELAFRVEPALRVDPALQILIAMLLAFVTMWLVFRGVRAIWAPAELVVGADGVKVRQRLRDRFVPYASIASVEASPRAVTFSLADGKKVRARARHLTDAERAQLEARLDAATAIWKAGGAETASLARLDRNGRSREEWRRELRSLLVRDDGYREARVTRDQLFGVLEDASARVERRVAAGVALLATEPEARARIRIAAEACANRRVRVALEKVADDALEDAAIEEAIAAEVSATPAEKGHLT